MKKRLFLILPVVALLAGCGETDPMAEVQKTLPSDVEAVDPAKAEEGEVLEYVFDSVNGLFNVYENKVVYNFSVDLSVNVSGEDYNGTAYAKGDLSCGYEVVEVEDVKYSSLFVKATDFTVNINLNVSETAKAEMSIPEHLSLNHINFYAFIGELEEATYAFFDFSDHNMQDFLKTTIVEYGVPESFADPILNAILGEKIEGSEYRPGKVYMNLSYILSELDQYFVSQGKESIGEETINHPVTYLLGMGYSEVASVQKRYGDIVSAILAMLNPTVGIKQETPADPSEMAGLDKISLVANVSSANIAEMMGVKPEEIPFSGVAGLLLSVGMENGEENDYALEELSLSVNLTYSTTDLTVAARGSVGLTASYNEQAKMDVPTTEELVDYVDITETTLSLIQTIIAMTSR